MSLKNINQMQKDELIETIMKLKNQKKYGLMWEEKKENVIEKCHENLPVLEEVDENISESSNDRPTNILIEGDNYHSLSVLSYTHKEMVDAIYIDPPFNTGNQSWKYNNRFVELEDTFRHSKWISWMSARLLLAKDLLKPTGIIAVAIDDYELYPLGLLLDKIFGQENKIGVIAVETNPRGRTLNEFFATSHEYCLFYARDIKKAKILNPPLTDEQLSAFKFEDDISRYRLLPFRRSGGLSTPEERPNSYYPIFYNENTGKISTEEFPESLKIEPIDTKGRKRVWRYTRPDIEPSITEAIERGDIVVKKTKTGFVVYMKDRVKAGRKPRTMWIGSRYDASTHGTVLLENILGKQKTFPYPKSIHLVRDVLNLLIRENKHAIVLDFFAGSGTTAQAVMEINQADDGNRQFIVCTNNENNICSEVCYPRIKAIMNGYTNQKKQAIAGLRGSIKYFRTTFIPKSKVTDDTRRELVIHSTEIICLKENTFKKVIDTQDYKLFTNQIHNTGILFNLDALETMKRKIDDLGLFTKIYVFSLTEDTFVEDFCDLKVNHILCPIPESILEVYKKVFKD